MEDNYILQLYVTERFFKHNLMSLMYVYIYICIFYCIFQQQYSEFTMFVIATFKNMSVYTHIKPDRTHINLHTGVLGHINWFEKPSDFMQSVNHSVQSV